MEIIKIPTQRIAVLVGKNGESKKRIEEKCHVKLSISSEGEVELDGEEADVYFAREVVQAIGRGFDPVHALNLLKEDYQLSVIDLKEHARSENALHRIKGRVIGEEGKVKQEIENATDSYVSIYGNTVAIISKIDSIQYAEEAVLKIIRGARHSSLFAYLAGVRRKLMAERLGAK